MPLQITASEMGLIKAAVRQYKTRRLKGADAKVFREMTNRLLDKLDAESSKYGCPDDVVELDLGIELDAFAESISDLSLPVI